MLQNHNEKNLGPIHSIIPYCSHPGESATYSFSFWTIRLFKIIPKFANELFFLFRFVYCFFFFADRAHSDIFSCGADLGWRSPDRSCSYPSDAFRTWFYSTATNGIQWANGAIEWVLGVPYFSTRLMFCFPYSGCLTLFIDISLVVVLLLFTHFLGFSG